MYAKQYNCNMKIKKKMHTQKNPHTHLLTYRKANMHCGM